MGKTETDREVPVTLTSDEIDAVRRAFSALPPGSYVKSRPAFISAAVKLESAMAESMGSPNPQEWGEALRRELIEEAGDY